MIVASAGLGGGSTSANGYVNSANYIDKANDTLTINGQTYSRSQVKDALSRSYTDGTYVHLFNDNGEQEIKRSDIPGWVDDVRTMQNNVSSAVEDFGATMSQLLDRYERMLQTSNNAYESSALKLAQQQAETANAYNAAEAEKARAFSAAEAEKARQWQAQREDSAYQRLVADLRNAGLNPILAYQSANPSAGSAASASSGAVARAVQANVSTAKNADKLDLDDLIPVLVIPAITSAIKLLSQLL